MVKIIWKHGEISGGESRFQVTREDIMRLPDILNEYEPIRNKRGRLEWTVAGDEGIPLVAVVGKQKGREPVTVISVLRSENPNRQLSKKREAPASPDVSKSSMEDRMTGIRDTTPGDYSNLHRGGEGLSSESIADNASEVNVVSSAPDFRIETSEEFTPAPPLSEKARSAFEDMGADEKTGTTPEEMQAVEQAALGQAPPEEAAALRAAQEAEISRLRMEEEGFNIMGCIMEVLE